MSTTNSQPLQPQPAAAAAAAAAAATTTTATTNSTANVTAPADPLAPPPAPGASLLSCEQRDLLAALATDWALCNGLAMRPPAAAAAATTAMHAPFALLPSPFPRSLYNNALTLQPLFNKIVHSICRDSAFLCSVTRSIGSSDLFSMRLLEIYEAVAETDRLRRVAREQLDSVALSRFRPLVTLGIFRSDYMVHRVGATLSLQQVELNTIAASFGALAAKTTLLHRHLARAAPTEYLRAAGDPRDPALAMPYTNTAAELAAAIAKAHELYAAPRAVVLFIVQPNERNIFDQRHLENMLLENHNIHVVRASLPQLLNANAAAVTAAAPPKIKLRQNHQSTSGFGKQDAAAPATAATASLSDAAKAGFADAEDPPELLVSLPGGSWAPVSVVYFRAGYAPEDYPEESAWKARLMIERSAAIKCPSVAQQLAGTKKMQQVLAAEGVLTRYAGTAQAAEAVAKCFTGIHPLDESPEGADALCRALANPEAFVLKPQREGGGNNIYGKQIATQLKVLSPRDRAAYILMDRITPPSTRNVLVNNGQCVECDIVSELGIYGVIITVDDNVVLNSPAGHLLRSKPARSNEGGVAAGFAVLDSPMLTEFP